jgi:hypothetical protein
VVLVAEVPAVVVMVAIVAVPVPVVVAMAIVVRAPAPVGMVIVVHAPAPVGMVIVVRAPVLVAMAIAAATPAAAVVMVIAVVAVASAASAAPWVPTLVPAALVTILLPPGVTPAGMVGHQIAVGKLLSNKNEDSEKLKIFRCPHLYFLLLPGPCAHRRFPAIMLLNNG